MGGTLASIETAADGFAAVAKKAEGIDAFINTLAATGSDISAAAKGINRVIAENEADIRPAITDLKQVAEKLSAALDPETIAKIKESIERIDAVSIKLDSGLKDLQPVFDDLGAPASKTIPTTNIGQALVRLNRIPPTSACSPPPWPTATGKLNPNGSIQQLMLNPELYDNLSRAAVSANEVFLLARPVVKNLVEFSRKIASDPGAMAKGALRN